MHNPEPSFCPYVAANPLREGQNYTFEQINTLELNVGLIGLDSTIPTIIGTFVLS